MSVESILAQARARTEETRFTETVQIGTFADGMDDETGDATRVLVSGSYSGPAQIKYPTLAVSDTNGKTIPLAEQSPLVKLPSGTVVHVNDEVKVTASTVDPSLVGRMYRVEGRSQAGQTSAARYPLEEQS
ncbi:DUF6093 family protein [Microbacterium sp.]|uniref:DUF6093 family protein n=1 Tax=Microbacterium sp. TaxID=51671 RepID=UPI0039E32347